MTDIDSIDTISTIRAEGRTIPGAITLMLEPGGGRLSVTEERAMDALLCGRAPPAVVTMVMRLHGICPRAQGHAAWLTLTAARNEVPPPATAAAHEVRVHTEALREHGLRICLAWARLLEEEPRADLARAFMAISEAPDIANLPDVGILDDLLMVAVYGCPPDVWLAQVRSRADLYAWAATGNTIAARFVAMVLAMPAPDVPGTPGPDASGTPEHRTALARRHAHHPLLMDLMDGPWPLAGHAARLVDMALLPARIAGLIDTILCTGTALPLAGQNRGDGHGSATVPCARGDLRHEGVLIGGRVSTYRIESPTMRAFAARGIAHDLLAPWQDRRSAEIAMQALDPCVPYTIITRSKVQRDPVQRDTTDA